MAIITDLVIQKLYIVPDQLIIWKIGPNKSCPSARSDLRKNRSVKGIRKNPQTCLASLIIKSQGKSLHVYRLDAVDSVAKDKEEYS